MELMFLVYAVENLTYKGSFFVTIYYILLLVLVFVGILKLGINFYNQNHQELRTFIKTKVKLKRGDEFILDKDVYKFKKGVKYIVSSVSEHNEAIYYWKKGSDELEFIEAKSHIENLLSEQECEMIKIQEAKNFKLPTLPIKSLFGVMVLSLLLHTFLPTRQTAIYMASAYAIQKVTSSDKTEELVTKGYSALSSQLTKWAEEVPEVSDMLVDAGLNTIKKEISK